MENGVPEGRPVSTGLSDCLPIDSTHLFCWISLPEFVPSDSPCPQEAYSQWLRGDGPSTGPCTPTHNPSLDDTEPLGSTLASEFALAVLLARGALSLPPLCHPDSSSFRTGFRCFLFQKLSLSSWLRCPGLPRSSPQIPPLQHGAHSCHHLVSGHLKLQALGETQRLHRDNAHSPAERDPGGKGVVGEGVGNV